jgi:hypothetical protein
LVLILPGYGTTKLKSQSSFKTTCWLVSIKKEPWIESVPGFLFLIEFFFMKKHLTGHLAINSCSAFVLMLLFFACTNTVQKDNQEKKKNTTAVPIAVKKPASSFNDTFFITVRSAVFYTPDSMQLAAIKKVNEKNVFESLTHESFFQMRNARLVLQKYWPGIKIIAVSRYRWLVFIKSNKTKSIIDLNTRNDISGIFLFDPKKNPEPADMMNIDTALGFYFEK